MKIRNWSWTGQESGHLCTGVSLTQTPRVISVLILRWFFCTRPPLPPRSTTIHPLTLARTWISPFAPPYASAVSAIQSPGPVNSVPKNIFNIVSSPPSILSLSVSQTKVKNGPVTLTETSPKIHRWQISSQKDAPNQLSAGKCKLK